MLTRTLALACFVLSLLPLSGAGLSVVSLNMAKETDLAAITRDLARGKTGDVLLLQEVVGAPGERSGVAYQLAEKLGMQTAFAPAAPGVHDRGLAILSRYPLRDVSLRKLKECDLRFRSRQRIALAATVQTPAGPVRVYNAHLDTRINAGERLQQIAPVIEDAAAFRGPRLIGGDFNTNDLYWLGNVLPLPSSGTHVKLIDVLMRARGFFTPFRNSEPTFRHFGRHLDWIYLSGLTVRASGIQPMPFSDHHAIWTDLSY